ncbi:MAG TPA: DNA topoisomerase VI subunit B [Thermoprotei archaeon]|nr:DNA topoisomerase VI subunit B [Thermoprotei archaeon]
MVESYQELSPSEFFYRNKQLAGFTNPARSLYTAFRELFENSMDACELMGVLPQIIIILREIKRLSGVRGIYKLYIQDNGSGIPERHILNALGKIFYSSKYVIRQSRGTFGLGGTLALLYGQITTGRPIKVVSSIGGRYIYQYIFSIDINKNEPIIHSKKRVLNKLGWRGTIIEFYLEGNYIGASRYIINYLKYTAAISPYAEILYVDPFGTLYYFPRTITMLPPIPKETKPHPHGIDLEMLKILIKSSPPEWTIREFLVNTFHRVGYNTADKFFRFARIYPATRLSELNDDLIKRLYNKFREFGGFRSPSGDVLSPIGEKIFREGIIKEFHPEYVDVVSRPPSSYSGYPFRIEAALAYGGDIPGEPGGITLFRYANKIPLLFDEGSDVSSKVLNNINLSSYKRLSDKPIGLFIHIVSTKVPFKSVGKEAIADIPEIEHEVELAIRFLLRRFTKYSRSVVRRIEARKRFKVFEKYLKLIGFFSGKLAGVDEVDVTPLIDKVRERYKVS